jgi:hypothetical protein
MRSANTLEMYSTSKGEIMNAEEFLEQYDPKMRDLALEVCTLLRSISVDLTERVNFGHKTINYGTGSTMGDDVMYISVHKAHINLGFMRGSELPDPAGILEGTGKLMRHVKIRQKSDLETQGAALRALLNAAFDKHLQK